MDSANAASAASTSRASSLLQRVGSAVALLPLLVGLVYWNVWSTALLVMLVTVVCLLELYRLFRQTGYRPRMLLGILSGVLLCGAALFQGSVPVDLTGTVVGGSVLLALLTEVLRRDREGSLNAWALTFAGAYYIGGLLSYYILLRRLETPLNPAWLASLHIPPGAAWVYMVMAITWLQDTAAFFVGRSFGRHRMAPYLSPKKTWEGAIGGFLASVLAALLAVPLLGLPLGYGEAVLIGAAGGVFGPIGDLAESLIKRQLGVKDAGNLIPGHGGILDRADSILFTAPVIYFLVILLTG